MKFKVFTSLCLIYLGVVLVQEGATSPLSELQKSLLLGYKKEGGPSPHHDDVTDVRLALSINNIDVNEDDQTMSFYSWMLFFWTDEYLKWKPEEFEGVNMSHFSPNQIWTPEFSLFNSKHGRSSSVKSHLPLIANPDGTVMWFPPFWAEVPCEMNFEKFPIDIQTCKFVFRSWSHRGSAVRLSLQKKNHTKGVILEEYEENSKWSLINVTSIESKIDFDEEDALVTILITMQRRTSKLFSYILSSGFALILIVILSYGLPLHFHLTRIVFHLFPIFLYAVSMIFFLILIPSGDRIPVIVNYYLQVIVATTISLILTILICHPWTAAWSSLVRSKCGRRIIRPPTRASVRERYSRKTEGVSYESLEETETQDEAVAPADSGNPSRDCPRSNRFLQLINFIAAFSFTVAFLTIHFQLKTSVLWNPE